LSGAYLNGANLNGADLSGADLNGANLNEADLSGADLSGAYLNGANLNEADLSGADLNGANLNGADLSGADLNFITGKTIYTLASTKHVAFYIKENNLVVIGCQSHSIEFWTDNGVKIGLDNGYSNSEIELYLNWIKLMGTLK